MKIDRLVLAKAQDAARWQGGVLTAAEADSLGIHSNVRHRLVADGIWRGLRPGFFALVPDSWSLRAWAGVLIGGPQAVLGHEAALHLAGLAEPPRKITVFVGRRARPPMDRRWKFIRATRTGYLSPPRTSVEAAIIDVGKTATADEFVSLVGRAVTRRKTTVAALQAELARRRRIPQRALMADILSDAAGGINSALERRYRLMVETPHHLPKPTRQDYPIDVHQVDNYYRKYRLIVEVDGEATHHGLAASIDTTRDNDHMAHGISTLRFTWGQVVDHSCQTASVVAQALTRGGWTGRLIACPRCRPPA